MEFASHYDISESGEVTGLKSKSEPFSVAELKTCPNCRGSLLMISRYGRIARRAKLDELTKKFTSWSNAMILPLMRTVRDEQDRLAGLQEEESYASEEEDMILKGDTSPGNLSRLVFSGPPRGQIDSMSQGHGPRYRTLIKAHRDLGSLLVRVQKQEQPFQRVHDMVENLRNRANGDMIAPFEFDSDVLQTSGELRVRATLLRCELALVTDALHCLARLGAWKVPQRDFAECVEACDELRRKAEAAVAPRQMAEADVFAARYALLSVKSESQEERKKEVDAALERLERALGVVKQYEGSTAGLRREIEAVSNALKGSEYYQPVTTEEMKQVYEAMASEFRGTWSVNIPAIGSLANKPTRHWYYCENRHPFTIGECGMAMETARCPQCGAAVGGRQHQSAEGVTRARDIERDFGGLHL
jgi:hypothetical protein